MTTPHPTSRSERLSTPALPTEVRTQLARLQARAWGVAIGLLTGSALFIATLLLVLQNGPNMGAHLGLLSIFMPGYSVSILGAFIGFVYAFVVGYGLGFVVGTVYNALARTRL